MPRHPWQNVVLNLTRRSQICLHANRQPKERPGSFSVRLTHPLATISFLPHTCGRFMSQDVMTKVVRQFVECVKLGRSSLADDKVSAPLDDQHVSLTAGAATAATTAASSTAVATADQTLAVPPKAPCFSTAAAPFVPKTPGAPVPVPANAAALQSKTPVAADKDSASKERCHENAFAWEQWAKTQLKAWRAPYYMAGAANRNKSSVKTMNDFHNWVKNGVYRQHLRCVYACFILSHFVKVTSSNILIVNN